MSRVPLFESGRATVDASGIARVRMGPRRAFERWQLRRISIQSTSSTLVPEARLYSGGESTSNLIDGTYDGVLNHTDTDRELANGEDVVCVWSGADVGATCTLTLEGSAIR